MSFELANLELPSNPASICGRIAVPAAIEQLGNSGRFAWEEFIFGHLRNAHTRRAYQQAIGLFLDWLEPFGIPLTQLSPGLVGRFFDQHTGSIPSKKLALAALRAFFDRLVLRHVLILNPAASVRGEKYTVIEGKTPELTAEQANLLLRSLDLTTNTGLRDRAIFATLLYTAARAGAVARLHGCDFRHDGHQYTLRFVEKAGKHREIPVRHDLEQYIAEYAACLPTGLIEDKPLFRTIAGRTGILTESGLTGTDIWRLVKRRLAAIQMPGSLSPHSFRVFTVTNLLSQGLALEDVQQLAGHADPRTTRLYDRRSKRITRNIVERISL